MRGLRMTKSNNKIQNLSNLFNFNLKFLKCKVVNILKFKQHQNDMKKKHNNDIEYQIKKCTHKTLMLKLTFFKMLANKMEIVKNKRYKVIKLFH